MKRRRRNVFKSGQNEEFFFGNRETDFVSDVVNRRGVHLESEEKLFEKCGIVEGVASKGRSSRRRYLIINNSKGRCFRSE
jgi:hypothetical protein